MKSRIRVKGGRSLGGPLQRRGPPSVSTSSLCDGSGSLDDLLAVGCRCFEAQLVEGRRLLQLSTIHLVFVAYDLRRDCEKPFRHHDRPKRAVQEKVPAPSRVGEHAAIGMVTGCSVTTRLKDTPGRRPKNASGDDREVAEEADRAEQEGEEQARGDQHCVEAV